NLRGTEVIDADMKGLSEIKSLTSISLQSRTLITHQGLRELRRLPEMRQLNLEDTKTTDEELAELAGFPRLEVLNLRKTKVTDAGLGHLKKCKSIQSLDLDDTAITDKGLRELAAFANLRVLRLPQGATQAGLLAISANVELEELVLPYSIDITV